MGFSSPWIRIKTGGLIRDKYVCNMTKYIGQFFISIIAMIGFWPWANRKIRSIIH